MEAFLSKSKSEMSTSEITATFGMDECQLGRDIRTTFLGDPFCFESKSADDCLDGTNGEDFDLYGAIRRLKQSDEKKKLALQKRIERSQHLKGEYGVFGEDGVLESKTNTPNRMGRKMLEARVKSLKRESKELEKLRRHQSKRSARWTALSAMNKVSGVYKAVRRHLSW
ncbi:unnamed protein product [Agarophyton chilense]|eukprot:gb/GEZJ01002446.1/.p1 GENE.gb/GEZJ01002446.1/~~gb/GEZJ01002446.1/.p1  ORF type:complete len:169 (+),score=36.71 gb/GEZJ01002446.1/:1116-1622(+)